MGVRTVIAGTAAALALLGPVPLRGRAADGPPQTAAADVLRLPPTGEEFRVVEDPASGSKALVRISDGRRFDSLEAAVAAGEEALPPLRRALDPALWPLAEDPARAAEPVRVLLLLRHQPVHEASLEARERARGFVAPRLAALRAALSRIAPLRAPAPPQGLQLGDCIEEEARLLTPAEQDEARRLRAEIADRVAAMRREILDAAGPVARSDQAAVADRVRAIPGARVLGGCLTLSAVAAEVPAGRLQDLVESVPAVARIVPDLEACLALDVSVPAIGASSWTGAGYDGTGVKVAVLDTGVDGGHPALSGAVTDAAEVLGDSSDPDTTSPDDYHGHGTHVAGIIASRDSAYRGVAPGASIVNGKCFYKNGVSFDSFIFPAADWAMDSGAAVINCSFGHKPAVGFQDGSSGFFDAAVADLGVPVAAAAGNGIESLAPGDGFNTLSVDNFADNGTLNLADDAFYGGTRQYASDGRKKPDLAAPGVAIRSCAYDWEGSGSDWFDSTGTSMASPHGAGALALLAGYSASWKPEGLKALLIATTRNGGNITTTFDTGWGWGALDAGSAFANRATVLERTFSSGGASEAWLRGPALPQGGHVALVSLREIVSNGSSAPTTYRSIVDLDVEAWDEATSAPLGRSASLIDNVERITTSAASTATLIRVRRAGSFPVGVASVDWALATNGGTAASDFTPGAPSIACSLDAGSGDVASGDEFTLEATVTNSGSAAAYAPTVTLGLPAGGEFSIVAGANPQAAASVPGSGGTRKVQWTIRTGVGTPGPKVFTAGAASTTFGIAYSSGTASTSKSLAVAPAGVLAIDQQRDFVAGTGVLLGVSVIAGTHPVTGMRLRNGGEEFGDWIPCQASLPWDLATGTGPRTVEAQLRDSVGRTSAVFGDAIFEDPEAPTGSFALSGGAPFLMPWESLTADLTTDDGVGSGVDGFRVRWGGGEWSDWFPLAGEPSLELPRPDAEDARAEGQFRDRAGNASAVSTASIRLVPADATSLSGAKSFSGTLAAGGDVDGFRIGALPGDLLTVRLSTKRTSKARNARPVLDFWDPDHAKVATGSRPGDARRPGLKGFPVTVAGEHWLLVRAEGAVPAGGIRYRLEVKARRAKEPLRIEGAARNPLGRDYLLAFDGVEGMTLSAVLRGYLADDPVLVGPDGNETPCPLSVGPRDSRVFGDVVLAGGSGRFVLRVPVIFDLAYELRLRPPPRARLHEPGD